MLVIATLAFFVAISPGLLCCYWHVGLLCSSAFWYLVFLSSHFFNPSKEQLRFLLPPLLLLNILYVPMHTQSHIYMYKYTYIFLYNCFLNQWGAESLSPVFTNIIPFLVLLFVVLSCSLSIWNSPFVFPVGWVCLKWILTLYLGMSLFCFHVWSMVLLVRRT